MLQHPFRTGDGSGAAAIGFRGHAQGTGKGFKAGFDDVVGVDAVELAQVQGHLGLVDHGHEKFPHQLGVVGADALCGDV